MISALLSLAHAADTPDWHADQARRFLKRGWRADADGEVRAGLALDADNVELNLLCVELALAEGDVQRALDCAHAGAAADEGDLDQRARLAQSEAWLRANFGWVALRGPDGIARVAASLESRGLQLDAELLAFTERAQERLRAGVALPARVALPAGEYTLQGHAVQVQASQTSQLELPASDFVAAAGRGRRLDLALGVIAFSGYDFENQGPGLLGTLDYSFPLGPTRLGIGLSWEARGYSTAAAAETFAPGTVGAALHYGLPIELGGALILTPALAARVSMLPGLRLSCDDAQAPFACHPGRIEDGALAVYASGLGITPAAELALELNVGRVVVGVRGAVGHVFGLVPDPGLVSTGGGLTAFRSDPSVLHAGAYSGAASVGIGL